MASSSIGGGLIARLSVKTLLSKAVLGIYYSQLLCLRQAGRDLLHCWHLVVLSTDGFIQIARVKTYAQLVGLDNNQHTGDSLSWFG